MRFDAPTFARAWLAVSSASAAEKGNAALDKTVCVEEHLRGVRLIATDRITLLTVWVPNVDNLDGWTEPSFEEAPERTLIASDADNLATALCKHVLRLEKRLDADGLDPAGTREVVMSWDERKVDTSAQEGFEGMDPLYVTLDAPLTQKVWLRMVAAEYPIWRTIAFEFTAAETSGVAFNPYAVGTLVNASRWTDGPITWHFGGPGKAAAVEWRQSDPRVSGFVMPVTRTEGEDENLAELQRLMQSGRVTFHVPHEHDLTLTTADLPEDMQADPPPDDNNEDPGGPEVTDDTGDDE